MIEHPEWIGPADTDMASVAVHAPDAARAARTRARCQAELRERGPQLPSARASRRAGLRRVLEPTITCCLGAVYLLEVLRRAVGLYR